MATSRLASRSPRSPIPRPAATVSRTSPASGDTPIKTAPVAPVKPTWASAWPSKVCPRRTRKYPTHPATMATMAEAMKAIRMKSYCSMIVLVAVGIALDLVVTRKHENSSTQVHDADRRSIKLREHGAGDNLAHGADLGMTISQIQHPVDGAEQRVEFVGVEYDRNFQRRMQACLQYNEHALGPWI